MSSNFQVVKKTLMKLILLMLEVKYLQLLQNEQLLSVCKLSIIIPSLNFLL